MEGVAQYLTRFTRCAIQGSESLTTATPVNPRDAQVIPGPAPETSLHLTAYGNYLRDGRGLAPYAPLFGNIAGDIIIQERKCALQYAQTASKRRPAQSFRDACVFWVDGSVATISSDPTSSNTRMKSAGVAVVYKRWPQDTTWKSKAYGLKGIHNSCCNNNIAELFAIKAALEIAVNTALRHIRHRPWKKTIIFSDSQVALREVSKFPHAISISEDIVSSFMAYSSLLFRLGIRLELRWVPGHSRVPGNTQADALAKKAQKYVSKLSLDSIGSEEAMFPVLI